MVKWDASTDQILLLKILETSQVNADVKAIADAWPPSLDKPTPRAITERLVRIRKDVKSSGVNTHFSVSSAKASASSPINPATGKPPAPGTPQKRAPRGSVMKRKKNDWKSSTTKKNGNGKHSLLDGFEADLSDSDSARSATLVPAATPTAQFKRPKMANIEVVKIEDSADEGNNNNNNGGGGGGAADGGFFNVDVVAEVVEEDVKPVVGAGGFGFEGREEVFA